MLFTKSIQNRKSKNDGIRICIMRRIKPEFEFDIWMPNLAPSTKLLKSYHDKKVDWKQFEKKFNKEVLVGKKEYVDILISLLEKHTVTILCWEKKGENCHRLLVAGKLKELKPKLEIKHL
jgi:uncharacterized protein YeaO (DUF488 family)